MRKAGAYSTPPTLEIAKLDTASVALYEGNRTKLHPPSRAPHSATTWSFGPGVRATVEHWELASVGQRATAGSASPMRPIEHRVFSRVAEQSLKRRLRQMYPALSLGDRGIWREHGEVEPRGACNARADQGVQCVVVLHAERE
jgi:hypothetical protein